ncbi:uncharacterized protein MONBRDRAFT_30838 [Monosiga brevicollis MX1]|uniref:Uncharacterized protein n=1 Tax=Monosiga brevicollis TaxID=81824 RepID=A9UPL0_MONBE|nr:uncharacterized protein MONBRDRAFT_30838 [Monosiga brevicollis MX1]EDQ92889.1 predicted protein [Monosiga brevicollis MX1]|eukprot:XP_001742651.1 hypothetical protein [Monosiga brevicollis MX1]
MSFLNSLREPFVRTHTPNTNPKAPDCQKCYRDVRQQDAPVVDVDGKFWHSKCFVCKICHENVRQEYYHVDDMILCPEHFEMRVGGFCGKCYGQLSPGERIVTTGKTKYHANCLTCGICDTAFALHERVVTYGSKGFVHPICVACSVCGSSEGQFYIDSEISPPLIRCVRCRNERGPTEAQSPHAQNSEAPNGTDLREEQDVMHSSSLNSSSTFTGVGRKPSVMAMDDLPIAQHDAVPAVVSACIEQLSKPSNIRSEGLFRVPGRAQLINDVNERFNQGQDVNLEEYGMTAEDVAGLLKMRMRQQMFPAPEAKIFYEATSLANTSLARARRHLQASSKFLLLRALSALFVKVVADETNKMNVFNLATSLGMSLFPSLPVTKTRSVLQMVVDHYDVLFEHDSDTQSIASSTLETSSARIAIL